MDSLSMEVYEGSWYTIGYFAHAMTMRSYNVKEENTEHKSGDTNTETATDQLLETETQQLPKPQLLSQGELF